MTAARGKRARELEEVARRKRRSRSPVFRHEENSSWREDASDVNEEVGEGGDERCCSSDLPRSDRNEGESNFA